MNEINLLRYHNRSAHEIHMLMSGELTDDFFTRVALGGKAKKGSRRSHPRLSMFFTILLALLCALGTSYAIYIKLIHHGPVVKPAEITNEIKEVIKKTTINKIPEKPDPLVMEGYSKVGDIQPEDSASGQQGTLIISDYNTKKAEENVNKPEEKIKPITTPNEPAKRIPVKDPEFMPVYSGTFMLEFYNTDDTDTGFIKVLAANNDMTLTKIGSEKKSVSKWMVYQFDKYAITEVAGRKVRFIRSFQTREAAMGYVNHNHIKGLISPATSEQNYYDWQLCCTKEDTANSLAKGSGVDISKVKIIKVKQ